jgi:hypothetical protein
VLTKKIARQRRDLELLIDVEESVYFLATAFSRVTSRSPLQSSTSWMPANRLGLCDGLRVINADHRLKLQKVAVAPDGKCPILCHPVVPTSG